MSMYDNDPKESDYGFIFKVSFICHVLYITDVWYGSRAGFVELSRSVGGIESQYLTVLSRIAS